MKVLVINDSDGHCNVFDISTPEKRNKIYVQMAQAFLEHGTNNWSAKQIKEEYGDEFVAAIDGGDADTVKELMEDIDLHFDRSGGGILFETELYPDFNRRLARNMG